MTVLANKSQTFKQLIKTKIVTYVQVADKYTLNDIAAIFQNFSAPSELNIIIETK